MSMHGLIHNLRLHLRVKMIVDQLRLKSAPDQLISLLLLLLQSQLVLRLLPLSNESHSQVVVFLMLTGHLETARVQLRRECALLQRLVDRRALLGLLEVEYQVLLMNVQSVVQTVGCVDEFLQVQCRAQLLHLTQEGRECFEDLGRE